jgi:hypothetical protein
MAEAQKLVETTLAKNPDLTLTELRSVRVDFEGESLSVNEIAAGLGTSDKVDAKDFTTMENAIDSVNHNYYNNVFFYETYTDVLNSGAMNHPEVRQIIDDLSLKIVALGNTTQHIIQGPHQHLTGKEVQPNLRHHDDYTHLSSTGICHTGGNQDTGTQCY